MTATPTFPLMALGPDRYTADAVNERFYYFRDAAALAKATREEQRAGARLKWDLVDNRGRSFRIARESRRQTLTPLWLQLLMTLFGQREAIEDLMDIELGETSSGAFEGAKARVWNSIQRNREEWSDEEPAVEAGREPEPLPDILDKAKTAIDGAVNVEDLFDRLTEAWPT